MQGFLHCVWPPEIPFSAAEKGEKKKVGNPNGDPVRGRDAPKRNKRVKPALLIHKSITRKTCYCWVQLIKQLYPTYNKL